MGEVTAERFELVLLLAGAATFVAATDVIAVDNVDVEDSVVVEAAAAADVEDSVVVEAAAAAAAAATAAKAPLPSVTSPEGAMLIYLRYRRA